MDPWWLVIFLAIFLIGVTKSGFGAGVGLMIVPMTIVAMDAMHRPGFGLDKTLGLMLPLLILGDLIAVAQHRRLFDWPIVKRLLPGTALGVVAGGLLLHWFHDQPPKLLVPLIKLEVGLESVGLVGLHWWRVRRGQHLKMTPTLAHCTITGAAAATSSTLAHAAGPIIALFLLPQRLERKVFVGTCAIYFFLLNTVKLPVYAQSEMFSGPVLMLALQTSPIVIAGAVFGFWVNGKMNDELFSRVVYLLTFLLGWYLLADASLAVVRHFSG